MCIFLWNMHICVQCDIDKDKWRHKDSGMGV